MNVCRLPCQAEPRSPSCRRSLVLSVASPPEESAELVALLCAAALAHGWQIVDDALCCPSCAAVVALRSLHGLRGRAPTSPVAA